MRSEPSLKFNLALIEAYQALLSAIPGVPEMLLAGPPRRFGFRTRNFSTRMWKTLLKTFPPGPKTPIFCGFVTICTLLQQPSG
jgi:hypothetical protein